MSISYRVINIGKEKRGDVECLLLDFPYNEEAQEHLKEILNDDEIIQAIGDDNYLWDELRKLWIVKYELKEVVLEWAKLHFEIIKEE